MSQRFYSFAVLAILALAYVAVGQDEVDTVQEAMSLSGSFAQLEALYSLAVRSDASALQELIIEADELADAISRRSALVVLFSRLVTLDPKTAVEVARISRFANDRRYEAEVWTEWAHLDLEAALSEAANVTSPLDRNLVAQALFTANRQADMAVTQKIVDVLGVPPDLNRQIQFAIQLANRSKEDAVDYINGIPSVNDQKRIANTVGTYLGRRDAVDARKYADRLRNPETRRAYLANVERGAGARDPRAAVDRAMSIQVTNLRILETVNAMKEYAKVDARGAVAYLDNIGNPTLRAAVENAIVGPMTLQDPDFAMEWAQRSDPNGRRGLYSVALAQTAVSDPDAAFSSAMAVENRAARQLAMQRVLSVVGQLEPERAVGMLDGIEDAQDLQKAHSMVARSWIQADPDAATDWLLSDPRLNEPAFCQEIAPVLVQADVNAARRLLSRLDGNAATILQTHIVSQLAAEHSTEETMAFIDQIENSEQRKMLRVNAIMSISQTDPEAAIQIVQTMPASDERDQLLQVTLSQGSAANPRDAARYIDLIQDHVQRGQIAGSIAANWYAVDATSAAQWLRNRPRGAEYDAAVSQIVHRFQTLGPIERSLIDDVSDAEQRANAYVGAITSIARNDPDLAQQLLQGIALPPESRRQLEEYVRQLQKRTERTFE